jgi:hypothetical protein
VGPSPRESLSHQHEDARRAIDSLETSHQHFTVELGRNDLFEDRLSVTASDAQDACLS